VLLIKFRTPYKKNNKKLCQDQIQLLKEQEKKIMKQAKGSLVDVKRLTVAKNAVRKQCATVIEK
jgi:hypothetical protein